MVVFYYYPYHWVLFCASLMCIVAAFQLRKYLSISGYRHLFAALICIFLWTVLRSAEIASVGLTVKAWFADLEWAALLGAMTAFFQVVIRHTGRVRWYRSRALSVVLFSVPAVFVLCLLFPQTHSFLRPSIYLDASRSLPVIGPSYSPLAWIFFIYSLALMVLSITLLLRAAVEERNIGFGQSVLLLLCLVLPIAVAIIDAVGALQMDLLPVAFMGSALLLLFSLSKYHMFHAVPAAYSKIVANMEPGIFIFNAAERLVDLNASAERMLHIQKSDVIGQHPDVVFSSQEELLSFFKVKSQSLAEFFLHGSKVCYEFAVTRLTDKRERLLGWLLTAYDVTERKRREERNRFMAMHDSLTGLPNRRALLETARQLLQYAVERDERLGIVYVDADNFKQINDTYGHDAGDATLKAVAERLLHTVRRSDIVARVGGDEFVLLLPGISRQEHLYSVAEKVTQQFERDITVNEQIVQLHLSLGLSLFPQHGNDIEDLIAAADKAMYRVKQQRARDYAMYDEPEIDNSPNSS